MLNYVRAELYKVSHRTATWVTLAALLGLEALLVGLCAWFNAEGSGQVDAGYMLAIVPSNFLDLGCYFTLISTGLVFAAQYKNSTLKNEVSFGLPRGRIYLGKLAAMLITALLFCLLAMTFYVGLSVLLLPREAGWETDLQLFWESILGALPIWIGAQGACCACAFLLEAEGVSTSTSILLFDVSAGALQLVGAIFSGNGWEAFGGLLLKIYYWLPTTLLSNLYLYLTGQETEVSAATLDCPYPARLLIVGAAWLVGFTCAGLAVFRRKEIK